MGSSRCTVGPAHPVLFPEARFTRGLLTRCAGLMIPGLARPFVVQSEDLDAAAAAWLRESSDVTACHFSDAGFDALLARADGLVVRTYTRVDAKLLEKAPRLK